MEVLVSVWQGIVDYVHDNTCSSIFQIVTTAPYAFAFWLKKGAMLRWLALSCVGFVLGYIFIGAWTGVVAALFTLVVAVIAARLDRTWRLPDRRVVRSLIFSFLSVLFGVLLCAVSFVGSGDRFSYLVMVIWSGASLQFAAILMMRENGRGFSLFVICSQALLVCYGMGVRTPFFALLDLITGVLVLIRLVLLLRQRGKVTQAGQFRGQEGRSALASDDDGVK